ncbi:MAG TPA: class I SAM-dependent methyltransferase [Mycobacteriales bacterium]|nr:class I SAM-dependent methyltransferase [Mycobacteriales bacterium]
MPELRPHLEGVAGWLTGEEAETLYTLARRVTGRGVIVEIGSFKGRSTICLALGSRVGAGAPVYAIDPGHGFKRFDEFRANIERAGVDDLVIPVAARSEVAFQTFEPERIELLFIDGSHEYRQVMLDFAQWTSKLVDGGMLVMHDTTAASPGSKKVAEDSMYRSRAFRNVRFVYSSMTVGQKVAETTVGERARNRASLGIKLGFDGLVRVRGNIPDGLRSVGRRGLRSLQRGPGGS